MNWSQLTSIELAVLLVSVVLIFAAHIYFHLKIFGRDYLFLRTVLLAVGLSGLTILFLKPTRTAEIKSENAILITNNAKKVDVENNYFENIHEILNSNKNIDTIIIKGDGLNKEDLILLDSFNVKFEPGGKQNGFIELQIPVIKEKQTWTLTGRINQTQMHNISVIKSNGDVQETSTDENGTFSFRLRSDNAGHFSYKINAHYPDSTYTETVPIKVLPSEKWKLLALSSAPSFELNYLKNYWVKLGNGFSLRQKVSDSRFKETFLINPKMDLDKLNRQTLSKFNFLMIDAVSWNSLKEEEQSLALNFVANGRLGLLFYGFKTGDKVDNINSLFVTDEKEISLDNSGIKLSQISIPTGYRKIYFQKTTSAATRQYGLGNIGLMAINDSYRFILADQSTAYQNMWATVFSSLYIAPSEDVVFRSGTWNWENEETEVNIFSRKEIEQQGQLNSEQEIAINKTIDQKGMYYARFAATPGWNTFQINGHKKAHKFFVHSNKSWQAMKQSYLHESNRKEAARLKTLATKKQTEQKGIPFYWGLLLSVIGFGSLWLHERIYS